MFPSHDLFSVSASVEITKEVSSSHANRADVADSGNGIFSGSFSGSYIGDGSGLTKVFEGTSASSSISTRLTTQETKTIFSGSFSGSYEGNGSGLTNIPASGIVGLNLSQIADGTATASISETNGFIINTDSKITGSLVISGSEDQGCLFYPTALRVDGGAYIVSGSSRSIVGLTIENTSTPLSGEGQGGAGIQMLGAAAASSPGVTGSIYPPIVTGKQYKHHHLLLML